MKYATPKGKLSAAGISDGITATTIQDTAVSQTRMAEEQDYLPTHEPLIGAQEASTFLGCFKPITILRMAAKGLLPCVAFPIGKTGKYRYQFKMLELETYVASLSRPAKAA
jgi:hypothetical protein